VSLLKVQSMLGTVSPEVSAERNDRAGMPARSLRSARKLLLARCTLFDHDYLATTVITAAWANVVRPLHFTAVAAPNQVDRRDENVTTAVALAMSADSLLGKRTHDRSPVLFFVARLEQCCQS
jgi:hypothetical protein